MWKSIIINNSQVNCIILQNFGVVFSLFYYDLYFNIWIAFRFNKKYHSIFFDIQDLYQSFIPVYSPSPSPAPSCSQDWKLRGGDLGRGRN